jgi:hypothetical protein
MMASVLEAGSVSQRGTTVLKSQEPALIPLYLLSHCGDVTLLLWASVSPFAKHQLFLETAKLAPNYCRLS